MPSQPSVDKPGRKLGPLSPAERRHILRVHDRTCQVKGAPPHGGRCSLRALGKKTGHDRDTIRKVLLDRSRGKEESGRWELDTLGDVVRAVLKNLAYLAPHQFVELKLNLNEWKSRGVEMLFPDLGTGPLYRQALRQHLPSVKSLENSLLRQLSPYRLSLESLGVWEAVTRWDEAYRQYWQDMLDWCTEVSVLAEEAVEMEIAREMDAERQRNSRPPGHPFRLADPFVGIPMERRDIRTTLQLVGLPEAFGVVLLCDLLTVAASEQQSRVIWVGELGALKAVRAKAVQAAEYLSPDSVEWQGVAQRAKNLWEEPSDPCHIRAKTEAVTKAFVNLDDVTVELRQRLQVLPLPVP